MGLDLVLEVRLTENTVSITYQLYPYFRHCSIAFLAIEYLFTY